MSRCTDNNIGEMLHAFELKQLDDEKKEQFELHLLGCDYCFEQVARFQNVADLLRSDADVKELVRESAAAIETAPEPRRAEAGESVWSRLRSLLWPDTSFILKPVVTYVLLFLLAYPAYIGIRHLDDQPVQGVQSLLLTGTRTISDNTTAVDQPLVVMFRIAGARDGLTYRVVVMTEDGDVVYQNNSFDDFNDREMATLLLAAGSLSEGRCRIDVFTQDGDSPQHEYTFLAE